MNNYKKILIVLFCMASFLKTGSAAEVSTNSIDVTMAAAGSCIVLYPGLADSVVEGILNLKSEKEHKSKVYEDQERLKASEFPESLVAFLTGFFLIGISTIGKNNLVKKR